MPNRLAAAALCSLAAFPARAGVTVTMERKGERTVITLEGNKARVEHQGQGEPSATIFDGDQRKLLIVNHAERSYAEMTEGDFKAMAEQMKQALASAPPGERAQMQSFAGKGAKLGETKYQPLGRSEKVAGHTCTWYRQKRGGQPEGEGCYIPWSAGVLTQKDFAPFVRMSEMASSMTEAMGVGGPQDIAREIREAPGFPAIDVEVSPDGTREEERLVKVERGAAPAERFRPPAGYHKASRPQ